MKSSRNSSTGSRKRTYKSSADYSDDEEYIEEIKVKRSRLRSQASQGALRRMFHWLKRTSFAKLLKLDTEETSDDSDSEEESTMRRNEKHSNDGSRKEMRRRAKEQGSVSYSPVPRNRPENFVTINTESRRSSFDARQPDFSTQVRFHNGMKSRMVHDSTGGKLTRQHIHQGKSSLKRNTLPEEGENDEQEVRESKNGFSWEEDEPGLVYEKLPKEPNFKTPMASTTAVYSQHLVRHPRLFSQSYSNGLVGNGSVPKNSPSYPQILSRSLTTQQKYNSIPKSPQLTQKQLFNREDKGQYKELIEFYSNCHYDAPLVKEISKVEHKAVESTIETIDLEMDLPLRHTAFIKEEIGPIQRHGLMKPCKLVSHSEYLKIKEAKKPAVITVEEEISQALDKVEFRTRLRRPVPTCSFGPQFLAELTENLIEEQKDTMKMIEQQQRLIFEIREKRALLEKSVISEVILPEITPEMDAVIDTSLSELNPEKVMAKFGGFSILRKDLETLLSLNWLNDEVINFYMSLIIERSKQPGHPSIHAFNSFFYTSLCTKGFSLIKRWTRKIDIFSFDLIFIPLHLGLHWCLAVIDFRSKKLQYYDSMSGKETCFKLLRDYLVNEFKDKKKQDFDLTPWTFEAMEGIPQQMNGSDCGMFTLKYAEFISRGAKLTFRQENMPHYRRLMVYEIMKCTVL